MEMRPAISHESLMERSDRNVPTFEITDPFSQSLPESALRTVLHRRNAHSPSSNSGNFLQVPHNNHFIFPASSTDRREGKREQNARRASSSMCDLSASAPPGLLTHHLAEIRQMSLSSQCLLSTSSNSPVPWLSLSPRTSPQNSPTYSPTSSGSCSVGTLSDQFSPDSPFHAHLVLPNHASLPIVISPTCTPHCSPHGSPFGSQTQICIRSVGAEC